MHRKGTDGSRQHSVTINGHTWHVSLATTLKERKKGLGGRADLPRDEGMLFVFPSPQVLEFCMRNCSIGLDIAFLDEDLRVVNFCSMAVEPDRMGTAIYRSQQKAKYALEVRNGEFSRAGLLEGQKAGFSGTIARELSRVAPWKWFGKVADVLGRAGRRMKDVLQKRARRGDDIPSRE
jgi:uncharacterized membrane protein (UPF0127 family)